MTYLDVYNEYERGTMDILREYVRDALIIKKSNSKQYLSAKK
ncbi:hypothetical protein [Aquimarina hainanensis]